MTPLVVAAHRARRSARSLAALVRRSLAAEADLLAAELVGEWIAADPASTAEDLDRATDAELLALCVRLAASLDEVSLVDTDMTVTVGEVRPSVRATLSWDVPVTVGDIVGVVTMIWSDDDGRPVPVSARHGGRREDWADGVELRYALDNYRPLGDAVERAAREAAWRAVDHGPQPSSIYIRMAP